ncbi:acylphosphatase [Mesorhizobium sp. BR1-1-16]|uniref:acylphosphatase n=1 Tax=Mesorhizobium sp. BR1-1-16 TaxID=2876653 RepID=UPI001CCDD004|nr:acylphosphatase [Mesorhizobium sp. BR1-1-16]MBZ9935326.1 acylphosphatase [Mesorhizobium sp. BR1-1-16]
MARKIVQVRVTGRVQGVGYRAFVEQEAVALNLSGWVRNRRDGSVEALFSGDESAVAAMLDACRGGPRHASVETVELIAEPSDVDGPFMVAPSL